MELKLQYYPESEILLQKAEPVETFNEETMELCSEMFQQMRKEEGCGLAAPQIGISKQVFVVGNDDWTEIVINPRVVWRSKQVNTMEEGCLSLPGLYANVTRPNAINVEYYNVQGKKLERYLEKFNARVFMHEYDHLEGWLFPFYSIPGAVKGKFKARVIKPWDFAALAELEVVHASLFSKSKKGR